MLKVRVLELVSADPRIVSVTYGGYYDYAGPRLYSERRYHGPHVYQRHSYRWRDRDWD